MEVFTDDWFQPAMHFNSFLKPLDFNQLGLDTEILTCAMPSPFTASCVNEINEPRSLPSPSWSPHFPTSIPFDMPSALPLIQSQLPFLSLPSAPLTLARNESVSPHSTPTTLAETPPLSDRSEHCTPVKVKRHVPVQLQLPVPVPVQVQVPVQAQAQAQVQVQEKKSSVTSGSSGTSTLQSAISKADDRRRRNRESSSRCYYNRKRIIDGLQAEIAEEKQTLTELYDRALHLRHENARLKRHVVTNGIALPVRAHNGQGRRPDCAVQLRDYFSLLQGCTGVAARQR